MPTSRMVEVDGVQLAFEEELERRVQRSPTTYMLKAPRATKSTLISPHFCASRLRVNTRFGQLITPATKILNSLGIRPRFRHLEFP